MGSKKLNYSAGDELPLFATPEEAMREGQRREEAERRRRQMKYGMNSHQQPQIHQQSHMSVNPAVHKASTPHSQSASHYRQPIPAGQGNVPLPYEHGAGVGIGSGAGNGSSRSQSRVSSYDMHGHGSSRSTPQLPAQMPSQLPNQMPGQMPGQMLGQMPGHGQVPHARGVPSMRSYSQPHQPQPQLQHQQPLQQPIQQPQQQPLQPQQKYYPNQATTINHLPPEPRVSHQPVASQTQYRQQLPTSVSSTNSAASNDSLQEQQDTQIATQLFNNHDIRNIGRLTADELQNLLQNDDGTKFCSSSIDSLLSLFGGSRFGTVNLNEFISLYKRVKKWRKCFVDNDLNGSFTLTMAEYHKAVQSLGYLIPFEVSEKLFECYAEFFDQPMVSKEMKFDRFVETLVWLMRLTKVFRKYDTKQEGTATIEYKDFIDITLYLGKFLPH
ncbi:Peflin or Penta-EF hand domain-containing protein 1 [Kluyveromyces marxianus]